MKNPFPASLITGMVLLVLACTSGSELIPPTPPVPGPGQGPILELTDEQRITVLNECGAFADALGDLKSDAAQQALVTYLKSRGEFEDAGAMGGNVWAYFHDGRLATFIPDWLDKDAETGGRVAAPDISGGRSATENGLRMGVPGGKKVMLFHGLGSAYDDNRPYLAEIFVKSRTKYIVQGKDATIENLKTVKDVDVFYINTHGGFGRARAVTSTRSVFSLWTSDQLSVEREIRYRADLDSTVLSYVYALDDLGILNQGINEWHYGITARFVYDHMSFTENSLLYIDACNGYTGDASTFKEFMMMSAENGAATYIGWTGLSDQSTGFPSSRFIFDRLLGAPVYMLEAPPQRPFDLDPIMPELTKYNLGVSRYGGKLDFESTVDGEIMLAPSIKYITMDDYSSIMTLEGQFGDNSLKDGKVTVGGLTVPYEPSNWSPDKIICDIPSTGPGSSGDVIVSVNGHESNIVPLSEWIIPLELTKEENSAKLDAHLKLRIRADVHRYRSKPEEAPKTDRPDATGVGDFPRWPFAIGSTGRYSVGGLWQANCQKDRCQYTESRSAVSRNGVLAYATNTADVGFAAFYKWSADMKTLYVGLIVKVDNMGFEERSHAACEGHAPTDSDYSFNGEMKIDIPTSDMSVLQLHFDENYTIQFGEVVNS